MKVIDAKCVLQYFNMLHCSKLFTVCVFLSSHAVSLKHTVTFTYSTAEEEI